MSVQRRPHKRSCLPAAPGDKSFPCRFSRVRFRGPVARLEPLSNQLHLQFDATDRAPDHRRDLGVREAIKLPENDLPQVFRQILKKTVELVENDDLLFMTRLSPVDVI